MEVNTKVEKRKEMKRERKKYCRETIAEEGEEEMFTVKRTERTLQNDGNGEERKSDEERISEKRSRSVKNEEGRQE